MRRLLMNRNDPSIKQDVSSKLFHYNTAPINKRQEFVDLSILGRWGEGTNFRDYTLEELQKYLRREEYDPFAVCCAVRVKIEELTYNRLETPASQQAFVITKKTRPKLEYAETLGFSSSETYYLLGIVYNDGMHWHDGQDNISPIASKLENLTIRNLISEVFS